MFNRSVADGLPIANSVSSSAVARAELAAAAPVAAVELPQRAVTEAKSAQSLPPDHQRLNEAAKSLDAISSGVANIQRSKEDSAKLEALRAKLILSYKSIEDTGIVTSNVSDLLQDSEADFNLMLGSEAGVAANIQKEKTSGAPDKDRVLGKIEAAINRIGQLQDKLGRVERKGYDFLLGLNLSVSSLNAARTQVDDSSYSVSAASTAVENVLINVRAAVVAHGRVSPEIVRLALIS